MIEANAIPGPWRSAVTGCAVVVLALVLALSPAPSARAEADADIAAHVAELRQLTVEPVTVQSMTQDELRAELLESSEEDLAEMSATQDLFVFLDFLEEGDNLHDILVEAHTEETLGFYDYEEDRLCLIGDSAAAVDPMDKLTLAHEYAHALQDQHFDLAALMEQDDDSEASGAMLALIEGDATVVMSFYYYYYLTEEEQAAIGEVSGEPGEADEEMPPIVEESLAFPYEYGMEFVVALIKEGQWEAVNDAYSDPPVSTEQIMHPRKYFRERDNPVEVTLPDMAAALGQGWTEVDSGVFGEFDLKLFLQEFVDESDAKRAAAGWGGDRYSFLEDESGANVFVLSTIWDEADEARQFYDSCVDRCVEQGGSGRRGDAEGSRTSGEWQSEDLSCRFALDEQSVYLVMAPDADTAGRAMSAVYQSGGSSKVWIWVVVGVGLAFLVCVLGLAVLVLRRQRRPGLAAESVVPPGGPPAL